MFHRMNKTRMIVVLLLGLLLMPTLSMTIMAQDDTAANQVELIGLIEAMDMDSITVNGQRILVAAAEINTPLQLGAAVKVEAQVQADLSIRARQINAVTPQDDDRLPGEIEITGLLTAFDGSTMTIAGLAVDVRGAEIKAGVVIGAVVKVHASLDVSGLLKARQVSLPDTQGTDDNGNTNDNSADDNANTNSNTNANSNDNSDDDNSNLNDNVAFTQGEFELRGTLTSVGADFIVVQGQNISTVGAEIKGTLTVGATVKVHLSLVNGALVAREVEMAVRARQGGDDNQSDDNSNSNVNSNDNVVVPANCVVSQPAGWTTYTIQAGDTLSGIAQRSGSSVGQLALANCITDARFIVVGATIFVPRPVAPALTNQNGNGNDNGDDNGNFNSNDNGDDNGNGNSNDNGDDNGGNDNGGNDNGGGHGGGDDNGGNSNDD